MTHTLNIFKKKKHLQNEKPFQNIPRKSTTILRHTTIKVQQNYKLKKNRK